MMATARVWICAALAGAVVSGCGAGGLGGGKKRVVFWQFWPLTTITPLVERFEKENPDLEVVVERLTWQAGQEKIAAAVAGGTVPDLVELGSTWFPAFAYEGALADWTDSAATLRGGYRLWDMCEAKGRVYGLPWLGGTRALFYNKTLFARAGLDSSRGPETWAELLESCRRIQRLGGGVSGYGANAGERYVLFKKFMPYAWSNGGTVFSLEHGGLFVGFDSPANVEALHFYLQLADAGRADQQRPIDQAFKEGKIGCTLTGAWLLEQIPREAPDLRYGVALVPRPEGGEHRSFAGGEILSSFAKSSNREGAWRLARFLLRPENALTVSREAKSVQPTSTTAEPDSALSPEERVFLEQLALAIPTPNHPEWGRMEAAIEDAVEQALYRKLSPELAIQHAAKEIIIILAKQPTASANR